MNSTPPNTEPKLDGWRCLGVVESNDWYIAVQYRERSKTTLFLHFDDIEVPGHETKVSSIGGFRVRHPRSFAKLKQHALWVLAMMAAGTLPQKYDQT